MYELQGAHSGVTREGGEGGKPSTGLLASPTNNYSSISSRDVWSAHRVTVSVILGVNTTKQMEIIPKTICLDLGDISVNDFTVF